MEISTGALDKGRRITGQETRPEEPAQDIAAQGELFVWSTASSGARFGILVAMATAEPLGVPRRAVTRPGSGRGGRGDHGPMAWGRVSLRMKISRPW